MVLHKGYVGDWFVLYQLSKNVNMYFMREFVKELKRELTLKPKRSKSVNREKKDKLAKDAENGHDSATPFYDSEPDQKMHSLLCCCRRNRGKGNISTDTVRRRKKGGKSRSRSRGTSRERKAEKTALIMTEGGSKTPKIERSSSSRPTTPATPAAATAPTESAVQDVNL